MTHPEQNFERVTKGFLLTALGDDVGNTKDTIALQGITPIDLATLVLSLDHIREHVAAKYPLADLLSQIHDITEE